MALLESHIADQKFGRTSLLDMHSSRTVLVFQRYALRTLTSCVGKMGGIQLKWGGSFPAYSNRMRRARLPKTLNALSHNLSSKQSLSTRTISSRRLVSPQRSVSMAVATASHIRLSDRWAGADTDNRIVRSYWLATD